MDLIAAVKRVAGMFLIIAAWWIFALTLDTAGPLPLWTVGGVISLIGLILFGILCCAWTFIAGTSFEISSSFSVAMFPA